MLLAMELVIRKNIFVEVNQRATIICLTSQELVVKGVFSYIYINGLEYVILQNINLLKNMIIVHTMYTLFIYQLEHLHNIFLCHYYWGVI